MLTGKPWDGQRLVYWLVTIVLWQIFSFQSQQTGATVLTLPRFPFLRN